MKNKTDSKTYMEQYLKLDKGEHVPFSLSLNLLTDKKCRKDIKALVRAEKLAAKPLNIPVPLEDDTIENVIRQIDPQYKSKSYKVSVNGWLASFIIILACLLAPMKIFLPSWFSQTEFLLYAFLFAAVVIIYCAFFIWSNMDFFTKKIDSGHLLKNC